MKKNDEKEIFESRLLWAHIVRGQAFQHYPKPNNELDKARINATVNIILVNEYGFTMEEAIAAEHEYYKTGMDFLDNK